MFLITVPTIDGSGTIRLERNFCFLPAICTSYFMHFARWTIKAPTWSIGFTFSFHYYILPFVYLRLFFLEEPRIWGITELVYNRMHGLWNYYFGMKLNKRVWVKIIISASVRYRNFVQTNFNFFFIVSIQDGKPSTVRIIEYLANSSLYLILQFTRPSRFFLIVW